MQYKITHEYSSHYFVHLTCDKVVALSVSIDFETDFEKGMTKCILSF